MKCPRLVESQKLDFQLGEALARETRLWKALVFRNGKIQGTDISPTQHDEVVLWLLELCSRFHFYPETFALATSILNRLLASVKAQLKYLRCIAITCMILAAKSNEEDDVILSIKDLAVQSGCNCSPAEILRMERIILDKLHWDLYIATGVDFINIFHAMVMSSRPHLPDLLVQKNPSLHAAFLTRLKVLNSSDAKNWLIIISAALKHSHQTLCTFSIQRIKTSWPTRCLFIQTNKTLTSQISAVLCCIQGFQFSRVASLKRSN
ncbi:cyclin-I-like isoform X3 [Polyodon spathula]|uniref:cyclin-I-like isoform X3 n=1 Tax=Polyodon spathula TaxID=7913 RepID=UPI001B7DEEA1|nr:cyclin-I-like isoform X3 [Polyodon spathula]